MSLAMVMLRSGTQSKNLGPNNGLTYEILLACA